ncbi:hypothetical protein EVAR_70411_1 [Eumeta japonica]|uniref:Ommochrome-binding protein n=1 Tax=Eumeta variegata TaxID=151549 RepID=A0A4C2A859_EUMVA|nr:hypothetical protein EVAR_70411_1 [Eumeta japonica]
MTKTYVLDLKTKIVTEVQGIQHAMGSVVHNDDFLIGTNNGLYKYDTKSKNVTLYGMERTTFYNVFKYNNKIYYIDYPKKDLYVVIDNTASVLFSNSQIEAFALDSYDNYYFGNVSGWYYGNLATKTNDYVAQSNETPFDNFIINPTNEIVYASSHYGVFKISRDYGNFKRICTKAMLDIVFESNGNIIYSDEEHIVRLKQTNKSCQQ